MCHSCGQQLAVQGRHQESETQSIFMGMVVYIASFQDLENPRPRALHRTVEEARVSRLNLETTFPLRGMSSGCANGFVGSGVYERGNPSWAKVGRPRGDSPTPGGNPCPAPAATCHSALFSSWRLPAQFGGLFIDPGSRIAKCLHFLRGKLHQIFCFTLGERCRLNGKRCGREIPGVEMVWVDLGNSVGCRIGAQVRRLPRSLGAVVARCTSGSRASTTSATEEEEHQRRGRAAQISVP